MAYTVQALCQFSVCTARHVHDCFADFVAKNLSVDVSVPSVPGYTTLMSVFGWIIIHQNVDSNFNWYRLWADYKAGFGSIDADFWLGLEKMHLLTSSQAYRLRVEVQEETTGDWYSAEYWTGTRPSTGLVLGRVLDWYSAEYWTGTRPSTGRSRSATRRTSGIASTWTATAETPGTECACANKLDGR